MNNNSGATLTNVVPSNQSPERVNVLGVGVSAINIPLALETIDGWIERKETNYVCVTGVHGVMESQTDFTLKQIHNAAGMVTPDGMPLVWLGKNAGQGHMARVYGPDLMLELCDHSSVEGRNYRHFFYGGAEGVPELLAEKLKMKFPALNVVGTYSPPFRPLTKEEDDEIVDWINREEADLVWIGLSTPKQERWMADHVSKLNSSVMLGVGAAFDFHSGRKVQAPVWMQKSGLEWFFRLVTEPKRLWKRYLINNPRFISNIAMQKLGVRKYPLET